MILDSRKIKNALLTALADSEAVSIIDSYQRRFSAYYSITEEAKSVIKSKN